MEQMSKRRLEHRERILYSNHKADLMLEERIDALDLAGRLRVLDVDREKIKVRNELKLTKKRNISTHLPSFHGKSGGSQGNNESKRKKKDAVLSYILSEFKHLSDVIPAILIELSVKKETSVLPPIEQTDDNERYDEYEPDLKRLYALINGLKVQRHMSNKRAVQLEKKTVSFHKLMANTINKVDGKANDDFTDSASVLLRRKMRKRKTKPFPVLVSKPKLYENRSRPRKRGESLKLPAIHNRLSFNSNDESSALLKSCLLDEKEYTKRVRISKEIRKYAKIQERISRFLDDGSSSLLLGSRDDLARTESQTEDMWTDIETITVSDDTVI